LPSRRAEGHCGALTATSRATAAREHCSLGAGGNHGHNPRHMSGPNIETPMHAGPGSTRGAIVVGASSGVGAALVRLLAAEGWHVVGLARRAEELAALQAGGHVTTVVHDVHDTAAVPELFERLVRQLGGLDLLVYAAGIMPKIGKTEYDTTKDLDILAVNFAGLVAWGNAAASLFGSQRSGSLVGVSSISGDRGRKGNPLYGASKAAMDNYLESLRNRLAEVGVNVVTIKPGFVATRMTAGMDDLFWVITPEQAAQEIVRAVQQRAGVRYVPRRWWCVAQVVKLIPSFIFKRLGF